MNARDQTISLFTTDFCLIDKICTMSSTWRRALLLLLSHLSLTDHPHFPSVFDDEYVQDLSLPSIHRLNATSHAEQLTDIDDIRCWILCIRSGYKSMNNLRRRRIDPWSFSFLCSLFSDVSLNQPLIDLPHISRLRSGEKRPNLKASLLGTCWRSNFERHQIDNDSRSWMIQQALLSPLIWLLWLWQ